MIQNISKFEPAHYGSSKTLKEFCWHL